MSSFKRLALSLCFLVAPIPVSAAELGYSTVHAPAGCCEKTEGLELNAHWGGKGEHYDGDRFSVTLGYMKARDTRTGYSCHDDTCVVLESLGDYRYATFTHRWYLRPRGHVRWFAGTGLAYRDQETCIGGKCYDGDILISSKWAFSQELGMKWREHFEISWGHMSTAAMSEYNKGENYLRLTILGEVH